jgi:hypothetical protein
MSIGGGPLTVEREHRDRRHDVRHRAVAPRDRRRPPRSPATGRQAATVRRSSPTAHATPAAMGRGRCRHCGTRPADRAGWSPRRVAADARSPIGEGGFTFRCRRRSHRGGSAPIRAGGPEEVPSPPRCDSAIDTHGAFPPRHSRPSERGGAGGPGPRPTARRIRPPPLRQHCFSAEPKSARI